MKIFRLGLIVLFATLFSCKSSAEKSKEPDGTYVVQTLKNQPAGDQEISLSFNAKKGQVHGNAVCNGYSATYVVSGTHIKFSPAMSTKMGCGEGAKLEYNFFQALLQADSFSLNDGELKVYDAQEQNLLIAKAQ